MAKKPAMTAAPATAETLRVVAPLFVGAGAGVSSATGPSAGPSAGLYSLPGAGGDETSLSGDEAGVEESEESSSAGEAAGVEEEEVGEEAEALGVVAGVEAVGLLEDDALGAEAEPCGAEADDFGAEAEASGDDDGVVGDDFGVGEAVGELVGA